jgi:hypothetical protein
VLYAEIDASLRASGMSTFEVSGVDGKKVVFGKAALHLIHMLYLFWAEVSIIAGTEGIETL